MKNSEMISVFVIIINLVLSSPIAGKCPGDNEVQKLDLNEFLGNWYMVAGTPVSGKKVSKCCHFEVKRTSDDTFTMNYTAVSHRKNRPVVFTVNARADDNVTGNWQLQGSTKILGPFRHRVISANYASYIVFVVCGDSNQIIPTREFGMIWSREKNLNPTVLKQLKRHLSHYFHGEDILDVNQTDC
ncbi:uncharacterized protein [Fopius arisanus]|uniref:LOPAP protein n=1 Tax=Fopius arisanus TaxID=64838 RepID=A0A0C9QGP7_9HYME|nr:PREDICTED: uncharacterized protein LOC105265609 isoform X1 [Fopius arisanus]